MDSLRRQTPEETREKIMVTAQNLFVTKGYFNTSIPDIVKESGISIGSIYHHFQNKQDLAKALYQDTMQSFTKEISKRTQNIKELRLRLYILVHYLYELCDFDPIKMEYMLFIRHTEIDPSHVPVCLAEPFQMVTDWIRKDIEHGIIKGGNPELLAGIFMGGMLKVIELRLRGVLKCTLMDVLAETFEAAYKTLD